LSQSNGCNDFLHGIVSVDFFEIPLIRLRLLE
jgi:hypothetical protein